jgi:very-short-patch-repair endonuclease
MIIHNKKELEKFRKRLRNGSTPAECRLWIKIKNRKLGGRKFRRQHSVGNFILDFYCPEEKLGIELDGQQHYTPEGKRKDKWREAIIASYGIRIIRFENRLVFKDLEYVLSEIKKCFKTSVGDHPVTDVASLERGSSVPPLLSGGDL